LVAGAEEFCGNGATRTTQKEAKLEEAGDGATRQLPQRLKGSMHVSMNYKGIRKRPEAQASGLFDLYWMQRRRLAALGVSG
jgi:hypothetical protein